MQRLLEEWKDKPIAPEMLKLSKVLGTRVSVPNSTFDEVEMGRLRNIVEVCMENLEGEDFLRFLRCLGAICVKVRRFLSVFGIFVTDFVGF